MNFGMESELTEGIISIASMLNKNGKGTLYFGGRNDGKILSQHIEQTEHGVPLIVSKYGKEVFDITENFIAVTIPLNKGKVMERNLQKKKGLY